MAAKNPGGRPKLDPYVKAARELAQASQSYLAHMQKNPEGKFAARALVKLQKAVAAFPREEKVDRWWIDFVPEKPKKTK